MIELDLFLDTKPKKLIVKNFNIQIIERSTSASFIEKWHYSQSVNGVISDYCFGLFSDGYLIGAAMFGRLAMHNQWKKYVDKEKDITELRRLCCIDDTPKNTESRFIGLMLKWLKNNSSFKKIVSYADPEYGHSGIIYKASNFELVGKSSPGKVIIYNGKKYHDKTIRTKYKGKLKPFAKEIKKAIENGNAEYKNCDGKNIFIYDLEGRRKS